METYKCSKCGLEKPVNEFGVDRTKKSGHKSQCKSCVKSDPARIEYMRRYREEHRDYFREKHAEFRSRNRERLRLQSRARYSPDKAHAYYVANRETILAKQRVSRVLNQDKVHARQRAYRLSEPGRAKRQFEKAQRRAHVDGGDKDITLRAVYERANGVCQLCGLLCDYDDYVMRGDTFIAGNSYPSIDHITPLSLGGTHTWGNVQLAHRSCNSAKRDRLDY